MTSQEAKAILSLYRPDTRDAEDPEIIEAMGVARRDPELGRWFNQHQAFQAAMQAKLREIKVPEHLKAALLSQQRIIRPSVWWQRPVWIAAAAAIMLLLTLVPTWRRPTVHNRLRDYQETMVSRVLLQYRMDLETNDMSQLRKYVATKGAPADYELTRGLAKLQLTGGAALSWRTNPISMVCFDRGDKQMVFLFVMKRSALPDPPGEIPKVVRISDYLTASWTRGDKTYVLAGPEEPDFARKYF